VKFVIEMEHKFAYKICMKYCLKHGEGAKFGGYMGQI
jgi:hypothetical protein